jgi:hypothetical protein
MKKIILFLIIIIFTTSCKFQKKEFTLIGKWKAIESSGSDGAKMYRTDIEDGNELVFEKGNIIVIILKIKGNMKFQKIDYISFSLTKKSTISIIKTKVILRKCIYNPYQLIIQFYVTKGAQQLMKK